MGQNDRLGRLKMCSTTAILKLIRDGDNTIVFGRLFLSGIVLKGLCSTSVGKRRITIISGNRICLFEVERWMVNCNNMTVNSYPAKFIYLHFQPLEVVSRYRDTQLQVAENFLYLFNSSTNICKF